MVVSIVMAPFTYGFSIGLFFFTIFFYLVTRASMRQTQNRQRILSDAMVVAETYESIPNEDGSSVDIIEEQYTFPKICPHCLVDLRLDKVRWVDSNTALCPECESTIRVGNQ